jgi:dihydrofolate reductase
MRKFIMQEWVSVDNYAARVNGEIDFFVDPKYNSGFEDDYITFLDRIDTLILGANTYKMFVDYWPDKTIEEEKMADKFNALSKIVFSKSLENTPWGKWEPARQIKKDPVETIKQLKNEPGKDLVIHGSISLVHTFIKAGLLDEYQFCICPVALGEGRSLFPKEMNDIELELVDVKKYRSGVTWSSYSAK